MHLDNWCHNRSVVTLQNLPRSSKGLRVSEPRFKMSAPEIGSVPRLRPALGRKLPKTEPPRTVGLSPISGHSGAPPRFMNKGGFRNQREARRTAMFGAQSRRAWPSRAPVAFHAIVSRQQGLSGLLHILDAHARVLI